MATTVTDLPAGHSFDAINIHLDAERVHAYRRATADVLTIYDEQGVVPPMAVAAFALGALLQSVGLTPGTLHANESLQAKAKVPLGATVECRARIAQRMQRTNWIVSVIESDMLLNGKSAVFARATVLCPLEQP